MEYVSTKNNQLAYSFIEAMLAGLAPDGGLFIPKAWPSYDFKQLESIDNIALFATHLLKPFVEGTLLEDKIKDICLEAFNFPIPLEPLCEYVDLLSLCHGPTLSFKDVGARFLATCLKAMDYRGNIMVATSGDTGAAVAGAFSGNDNIRVVILFPNERVTPIQEAQMTCWADNIVPLKVSGDFDDCQRMVKEAFAIKQEQNLKLTSANSINIARLLPQMIYYAFYALQKYKTTGKHADFIIPSGNLGHATACCYAKHLGFPVGNVVIATNANKTLSDYMNTQAYKPRASIKTLANAMDVGAPSNFERLMALYPSFEAFSEHLSIASVSDEHIIDTITEIYQQYQRVICPHTACAVYVQNNRKNDQKQTIVVETAHPVKFESVYKLTPIKKISAAISAHQYFETKKTPKIIPAKLKSILAYLS